MKVRSIKIMSLCVSLITISSVNQWSTLPIGNTTIWWLINTIIVMIMVKVIFEFRLFSSDRSISTQFVKALLIWYAISILRGCFIADNYWEWKNLIGTSLTMMIPLIVFFALYPKFIQYISQQWFKWMLPLFFLFYPFLEEDGFGQYLVPVSIFLLFFSLLTNKWKLILLFFSFIVFLSDLGARSNIIKFTVPLIMNLGFYIGIYQRKRILSVLWGGIMLLPFILFVLGATDTFNIFKMDEYIGGGESKVVIQNGNEVNLTADTRTFIYQEVVHSAIKHNYYIWGRTPARGNESEAYGWGLKEELGLKTNERFANEMSIANIFTWTGLIGVLLYYLVFLQASYLAVVKSRNQYIRIVGLYLGFRWCYAWVEDFTRFDLANLFLWILIGMCISGKFRQMNDKVFRIWIRGIFDKHYRLKKTGNTLPKNPIIVNASKN